MSQILLLGTFHFMEEGGPDLCSGAVQRQLLTLAQELSRFQPDRIAVEAPAHAQQTISATYRACSLADLADADKLRTTQLGQIMAYGQLCPVTYQNEAVQIGYRLGKMLRLPDIHAIDDDTPVELDALGDTFPRLEHAKAVLQADMAKHRAAPLPDRIRYFNSEGFMALSHAVYLQANAVGGPADYAGAELVAKWYARNLRIFSNIQRISRQSERLFVLYGAVHLPILRELINKAEGMELADTAKYL